jgi:hypothetical protein
MCTPITSFTFAGNLTINGQNWPKYSGQLIKVNPGGNRAHTGCYNRQGNKLTITTYNPLNGQPWVNELNDVSGRITGTLKFPGFATVKLDGTGRFN